MKFSGFVIMDFLAVLLAFTIGCATVDIGGQAGINWALAKNDGRVEVFSQESDHPASALIDGVTSSDMWDQGGGWQASITTSNVPRSVRTQREEQERNWVVIELAQPVTVYEVKIYTIDSQKYPAKDFGVSDLLVQYELQTASKEMIWANVKRPGKGIGDQDNAIRGNKNGVITVRFEPVNTQKIRILIYGTNNLAMAGDSKSREGVIRLTEIEVYGSGKLKGKDKLDELFEK